jgi:NADH:ubiquinone oxidoreductase subunit F (NADH-binding)
MSAPSPIAIPTDLAIHPGPALLSGIEAGASLVAHRAQYGDLPVVSQQALLEATERLRMRGRGGAAFPFAVKMRAACGGKRPYIVVNLSEGEPASAKDSALAVTRPHLVLDGAVATAVALRAHEVHVILPGDRTGVVNAVARARPARPPPGRTRTHQADPRFVAGQARAVLELMAGRPNLPVTAWAPEAMSGHKGHPTLLSNAETWAQIGLLVLVDEHVYSRHGTDREPGTTLMTLTGGSVPEVKEVPFGTRLRDVLPEFATGRPALVGGFHGAWAPWATLASARVSVDSMRSLGIPLGAGVVVSSPECPVTFTAKIVDYLAGQSAGRCGPCFNGLPALATALQSVVHGRGGSARVEQLAGLVVRRGACAHPDGTVRLVRSMLSAFPGEIAEHAAGSCGSLLMEPSMGVAS